MKLLVLSDSHASLHFMRRCVAEIQPDAIVHLGDYWRDGEVIHEENSNLAFYAVPGNCDRGRMWRDEPETRLEIIGGVRVMMTHGHLHKVKLTPALLMADARAMGAQLALFGHTHEAFSQQQADGLWVLNPGSSGYGGGSAGVVEIAEGKIRDCRII